MKRVFLLILVACLPIISACSADSSVAPKATVEAADSSVALFTISAKDDAFLSEDVGILYDTATINPKDAELGMNYWYVPGIGPRNLIVRTGSTIHIAARVFTGWRSAQSSKSYPFQLLSDWTVADAGSRSAVRVSNTTNVYMQIWGYSPQAVANEEWENPLPMEYVQKTVTSGTNFQLSVPIPMERGGTKLVIPFQVLDLSCSGNGTATIRSTNGLLGFITDEYGTYQLNKAGAIPDLNITCTLYKSAAMARAALGR